MAQLASVVTFKWSVPGYRSTFTAQHVNTMREMVRRHYPRPLRFICVTDDATGLDPAIEVVPLWTDHADLPNITFRDGPSCYRRLKVFAKDFAAVAGERFICMDLDGVVVRDLTPVFDRPEPFVIWNPSNSRVKYCASMFMMDAGAAAYIWENFDPARSLQLALSAGKRGSDQAWINYCVPNAADWTHNRDGVYSYRDQVMRQQRGKLPDDARVIFFCGKPDPWDSDALRYSPWLANHYC